MSGQPDQGTASVTTRGPDATGAMAEADAGNIREDLASVVEVSLPMVHTILFGTA